VTVRYARSGDAHLAYRTFGDGPIDLVHITSLLVSFDAYDENPHTARFGRRLSSFARVIEFDPRGLGLSDSGDGPVTLDTLADDTLRVLDAAGSEQAILLGIAGAGSVAITVAAAAPERVRALVLVNSAARMMSADDHPIGFPESLITGFLADNIDPDATWEAATGESDVALMFPSLQHDPRFRAWLERSSQRAAGPAAARRMVAAWATSDVRPLLPRVTAPTLVLARAGDRFVPAAHSRHLAEHIDGARYVELPGNDHMAFAGDADALADEIEEFVTGQRSGSADRILATLVFTDIVDSTRRAGEIGDVAWRAELDAHDSAVRRELERFRGHEVNTTGDGIVAMFDSPTSAVECARAIATSAGIPVRVGVHTGECERRGDDVAGLAVHIAARVAALAGADEVLVSRTVCDLVAGSALHFESRGEHELKGVDRRWELFALER
jgi:pimeloyl-ACP methyl ester carboxylesterase